MRRYLRVDNTICHKEYLTMVNVFVDFYTLLMDYQALLFFFLSVTCKEILLKLFLVSKVTNGNNGTNLHHSFFYSATDEAIGQQDLVAVWAT